MAKFRTLTDEDVAHLTQLGYPEKEIKQIARAARKAITTYRLFAGDFTRRISREEAIEILGRKTWLSGLCRSAFHYTSVRENDDNSKTVHFDSSRLFKD
jgi:hypothetical protein